MKQFLKMLLAVIVGMMISNIIPFLIFLGICGAIMAGPNNSTTIKDNAVLRLSLSGEVEERSTEDPLQSFIGDSYTNLGLNDILKAIEEAKNRKEVKGIYIESGNLSAAPASLQAIRRALADFKESGKFIYAYGDNYTHGTYYLASVADSVFLNPIGSIQWKGLYAERTFLKDLFTKVGVEMQIFKVGTYKAAVEPYTNTEMSEANKEQTLTYLKGIWAQFLTDISRSRNISIDSLNAYADANLSLEEGELFVTNGMVDKLAYQPDVRQSLMDKFEDEDFNIYSVGELLSAQKSQPKDKEGNQIAVYYATGAIVDEAPSGYSTDNYIVGEDMCIDLRKLRSDDDVKAVVLRINSPGGSGFASEQIWKQIELLKAEKPVVVSMGDYAASGGYYLSCNADKIFAEATTLTGSIGVFAAVPNVSGLMKDKLGLHFDGVKTNAMSDFGTMSRGFNTAESAQMQKAIDKFYDLFTKRCAEGRGMEQDSLKLVAEGRVWTGEKALELGLVDAIGGLEEAIAEAAAMAEVESYTLRSFPTRETNFFDFFNKTRRYYVQSQLQETLGVLYPVYNTLQQIQTEKAKVQARLPYLLRIE